MVDVNDYFSRVAGDWDAIRAGYFTETMRDDAISHVPLTAESIVADLGTGTGFVLSGLAQKVGKAYGFDASAEMLAVAQRNLAAFPNVDLQQADGETIPLPDASLDAAFANMYLHHTPNPPAAIVEMVRLLKPGGWLCMTDMDSHAYTWAHEVMADRWLGFDRAQVREWLIQAGLDEVQVTCAAGTCSCDAPQGDRAHFTIFLALGKKSDI
jgi:ubiquinone/menaquinone biosynthesis C-methylase UbiE